MPITTLPFTNGFYVSDSMPLSQQRCKNMFVEVQQAPSLSPEVLRSSPGITQVATTGSTARQNRGALVMNEVLYVVSGQALYEVGFDMGAYTTRLLGTVTGLTRVSMAENGTQLVVLEPGGAGYVYNATTDVFAEITDSDFRANGDPQFVVYIDGYFAFTTDEKKFIVSALNDGLSYNALDFGSAESDPDDVVAPIVIRNQLFITGKSSTEGFQNIGGADFPFQRSGIFLDKGVYAPYSLIKVQDTALFIGGGKNDGAAIWQSSGSSVEKISTIPIDSMLQGLGQSQIESIYAWQYSQKGHFFVGFALPKVTLVYDLTTGRWSERTSYRSNIEGRYRVSTITNAYNKTLCTDFYDGRIGEMSDQVYDEYGNEILKEFSTQPFQNNMQSMFVPILELTVEAGVGDSVITMDRSTDGFNWNAPRPRTPGNTGDYAKRCIWRRNGRAARYESFRFRCSSKVKLIVMQLTANIEGGFK